MSKIKIRPGKATLTTVVIMLLLVLENCNGLQDCDSACFGPIWKVNVYNEDSAGFLSVKGRHVQVNNKLERGYYLYKISKGGHFYLFDPKAHKFICWNKHHTNLIARKYKKSDSLKLCEFTESVSDNIHNSNSHVQLNYAYNETIKMKFNRKGRFSTKKILQKCKAQFEKKMKTKQRTRHHHVTVSRPQCEFTDFLVVTQCGCEEEAFNIFCCSEMKHMKEMSDICHNYRDTKCENNETYYHLV